MRIFVAGATGVLGRRAVPQLVRRGHQVTGVARGTAKAAALREHGAAPIAVDLFDGPAVSRAVDDHEVVVNLATAIPPLHKFTLRSAWQMTNRLRSEAARHLVDGALAAGARRCVQEALGFAYGGHGATWIDEDAALQVPDVLWGLREAEAQAARFDGSGGDGVTLRFGQFYSADSPHTRTMLAIIRCGLLPIPGRPDDFQSWVHVDDAAAAVVAAVDARGGRYNVVEDDPLTNADHTEVLGGLVGRRVRHLPAWLAVTAPLTMQVRSQRVSNAALRRATSWQPTYGQRRDGWEAVLSSLAADTPTQTV